MNTLETDIEIGADGSVRLLSPLPAWLKPGRAHVLMTVESVEEIPKRHFLCASTRLRAVRNELLVATLRTRFAQQKRFNIAPC